MTTSRPNTVSAASTLTPPSRGVRLGWTILPFIVYLVAQRVPLPTYHALNLEVLRDWSDSDNVVAVGIFPWIFAAIWVEIVLRFTPGWRRLRDQGSLDPAKLHRITNLVGLPFAIIHAAWITYDLSDIPNMMFDPSEGLFPSKPHVSSPILVFAVLMVGAIGCKIVVDFVGPRSWLDEHGRALAIALLLMTFFTMTREKSRLDPGMSFDMLDLLRIAVNLLKCGMLVSFILIKPDAFVRGAWERNAIAYVPANA